MKQVSRTTTTKVAVDYMDPLSAFAKEQPPQPPPAPSLKVGGVVGSPESNVGGFHIRDDADQRDKSEFVTVEKLKIVGTGKKESSTSSTSTAPSEPTTDSPKKMSLGNASPLPGRTQVEESYRLPAVSSSNNVGNIIAKKSSGDNSPVPTSQETGSADGFPFMTGEMKVMSMAHAAVHVIPVGGINGTVYMTNFRLVFLPSEADLKLLRRASISFISWLNVPLAVIDRIEREKRPKETPNAGITMMIYCKDCRQLRINIKPQSTSNGDYDLERAFSLMNTYAFPNNLRYLFAFNHSIGRFNIGTLHSEYARMGLLNSSLWRISHINQDFRLCSTYPDEIVVPCGITDDELHVIGAFRSGHRLPVLCWATTRHSASLWRSSQPKAGVSGSCLQDIRLLDVIARSTSAQRQKDLQQQQQHSRPSAVTAATDSVLYIVDARSRNSAMANMAAGAGYETQNYYASCRLDFYNIPNIHAVRDSYKSVLNLVLNPTANPASDLTFSKQVEDTAWLTNVRLILKASFETAAFINKGYPVLVHCSHGWDRTAQITALAQLFLDPFYRTFEGFPILIEKEWLAYGHQFQMRCAHGQDKSQRQDQEFSPIFIQFLDCLWQILYRFGQYFEFNTKYVLAIADHVYSGRFGTFLFSCEQDRRTYQARTQSADLWQYLACNRAKLTNPFYTAAGGVFLPPLGQLLRGVTLWSDYFLRWSSVVSLPSLTSDLALYHTQLQELESTEESFRVSRPQNVLMSNPEDAKMFEVVSSSDYVEAIWARERFHRLSVEKELNESSQRHQRSLEKLLSLVRERVAGEVMAELEHEIQRMEDEEALSLQQSISTHHGNVSDARDTQKTSRIGPNNEEDAEELTADNHVAETEDFRTSSHGRETMPDGAGSADDDDIVAISANMGLPANLSSAECIEVMQTAAEVRADAAKDDVTVSNAASALHSPTTPNHSTAAASGHMNSSNIVVESTADTNEVVEFFV